MTRPFSFQNFSENSSVLDMFVIPYQCDYASIQALFETHIVQKSQTNTVSVIFSICANKLATHLKIHAHTMEQSQINCNFNLCDYASRYVPGR